MQEKIKKYNWSKILSLTGLLWIASGHFYPIKVSILGRMIPINAFSEFYLIPVFAVWRLKTEKDSFQKKRVLGMMGLFILYWILIPVILRGGVPLVDGTRVKILTSYHAIGSVGFFLFFIGVLLFGKRADCGWNCTCVFTRETLAFPFRDKTKKGGIWWQLRHLKWIMLILVWSYFMMLVIDPVNTSATYGKSLYRLILDIYYITVLLIPFTGHRNICRFTCPWSATWAVLNKIGPYKIVAEREKCIGCGICDRECDMGIPVQKFVREKGVVDTGECMGCERCVRKCPKGILKIKDFRSSIKGHNLSSKERGLRVVAGLTLAVLPFMYSGVVSVTSGVTAVFLFITGLVGYCPFKMLKAARAGVAANSQK